ncbi:MAG: DUF2905 domain-containing protein [Chthonomonadaceae bacterium]|nr:DUF2905 domain-containing protein [Chthonomonadaceae bacterium]
MGQLGKYMVISGLGIAALGALLLMVNQFFPGYRPGRLPGDIVVEKPGLSIYVPIVSMVLLSALATLILYIVAAVKK